MELIGLTEIRDRLATEAPAFRELGYAADFNAATQPGAVIAGPAVFILITGEEWAPVRAASAPMKQWCTVTVSLLIAVRLAGGRGDRGLVDLVEPVTQARNALFGWHHPDADGPLALAAGGVEDFDGKTQVLVYRLDFTALTSLQETLP